MSNRTSQADSETYLFPTKTSSLVSSDDTFNERRINGDDGETTTVNSLLRDSHSGKHNSQHKWSNKFNSWFIRLLLLALVLVLIVFISINIVYVIRHNSNYEKNEVRVEETKSRLNNDNVICGQTTQDNRFRRVIGGHEVKAHSWPWLVSIRLKINSSEHHCGGSLIDDEYVLTAGHCLSTIIRALFHYKLDISQIFTIIEVYIGVHDNLERKNETSGEVYGVKYFDIHDDFKRFNQSLMNDIAIIQLDRRVDISSDGHHVGLVCLPSLATSHDCLHSSDQTIAVGWGSTVQDFNQSMPSYPHQATFSILDPNSYKCNQGTIGRQWDKPNMYCAHAYDSNKAMGTCFGDSGGPVVAFKNNRWVLIGIISHGHLVIDSVTRKKLCDATKPSYFVKVSSYLDWIYAHVNSSKHQIDSDDLTTPVNDSQDSMFK